MPGRISGLETAGVYVNPDMPASVVKALAERGLMPDGSPIAGLGTQFNRVLNPIRSALGVQQADLPPGVEPVDYGAMLDAYDSAMTGFGGADPYRKSTAEPVDPNAKMQDRVPQEAPPPAEEPLPELAPAPDPYFGLSTAIKLANNERAIREDNARLDAQIAALFAQNELPEAAAVAPAKPQRGPISGMSFTPGLPAPMPEPKPPIPRARPAPVSYTVKAGDNPTTIARTLGISLKELERKNPGILKKARRLQVGRTLKV